MTNAPTNTANKTTKKCIHNKRFTYCAKCGGGSICSISGVRKINCKTCPKVKGGCGRNICEHGYCAHKCKTCRKNSSNRADKVRDKKIKQESEWSERYGNADKVREEIVKQESELSERYGNADKMREEIIKQESEWFERYGNADKMREEIIKQESEWSERYGNEDKMREEIIKQESEWSERYGNGQYVEENAYQNLLREVDELNRTIY